VTGAERDAFPARLIGMARCVLAAAGAALCLLAAGCGSVPAGSAGTGGQAAPGARTGTEAGNKRLAEAEAARLVTLVPVPPGAVPLNAPPAAMPGPVLGSPEVASLADRTRSWRLPMSFTAARAWITAHRPRGLSAGSQAASFPAVHGLAGYGYQGPAGPAWGSAELDVGVAAAPDGQSVMRADGLVIWLDPGPARDSFAGPRLRVLVAGQCPASDRGVVGVTNPGAGLGQSLLPAGRPRAGLECYYLGLNGRPFGLRGQVRLDAAQAGRVAAAMGRIPLSHQVGGVVSCPMDDESAELIALSYAGRPDVDLWVDTSGCGGVSNGHISAGG
jgi:hypothetical protein